MPAESFACMSVFGTLQMVYAMMTISISRSINPTTSLIAPILLALLMALPCHAGLTEGLAAYEQADYVVSLKELAPLAEKGNARSQTILGRMYGLGQGVPKDARASAEWFLKAAEQGVAEAQGMLGYLYLVGEGAPQSNGKAYTWMRKAAKQGDAMAQYNLGVMLGGTGIKADPVQAARWMRKAAEQEQKNALSSLAAMYQEGKGVKKDLVLAHMLYGLSGKKGQLAAFQNQKTVAAKMSAAQINEARSLAKQWKIGAALPAQSRTGAKNSHEK